LDPCAQAFGSYHVQRHRRVTTLIGWRARAGPRASVRIDARFPAAGARATGLDHVAMLSLQAPCATPDAYAIDAVIHVRDR
jgi:hypothetical protein